MATASLALVLLTFVPAQSSDNIVYSNRRDHRIPVSVTQPERRKELREILLFVSPDRGKTWQQSGKLPIEMAEKGFAYVAPGDGEYWLKMATVNQQGQQQPQNIYEGPVDMVLLVDMVRPQMTIVSAQRQGSDVVIGWEIVEANPDPDTLKMEYQEEGSTAWVSVPLTKLPKAEARFHPSTSAAINVRMTFSDRAKNQSQAFARIPAVNGVTTTAFSGPQPAGTASTKPSDSKQPGTQPQPAADDAKQPAATTKHQAMPSAADAAATGSLPPIRHVNNREMTLEYELSRVGPSGVGQVDLWWTPDNGKTWNRADPPKGADPMRQGRYMRKIKLDEDGIYGFTLAIKNRAGLGKTPPRPGVPPEIRIELDTVPPEAKLYAPRPDSRDKDSLLLTWTARDKNLADNPITLEWAEKADGPWRTIAQDLPNTGEHSWRIPTGMPVRVYLRLRARDMAGNEGIVVTSEAQFVDLVEPEGHLVNVTIAPGR
jgi:hypothetical protein